MNHIKLIPTFQRKKTIPKQLKDLELFPLNEQFSKLTMPIIGDDYMRPVMMGNFFDMESKKIVSTDAHKLTAINMPQDTYGLKGSLAMDGDQENETASDSTIFVPANADTTTTFIVCTDFTACPALNPSAWSNKVFGSLGYQWNDCDWQPSLFLFGEAEFGKDNVAISQWGVGLKGGIAF